MKIEREELVKTLNRLKPGLSPKELIEGMISYNFLGEYIATFNDLISVFHPFKTDFNCAIKADNFLKVLSKNKEKEITIDYIENEEECFLNVKTKRMEAQFPVGTSDVILESMTDLENEFEKGWKELSNNFIDGIYYCMFSAAIDPSQGTLTCISIDGNDIMSCDNARSTWYTIDTPMKPFLIKANVASELKKYEPTHYKLTEAWVHFKNDEGTVFNVRRVKGVYDDLHSFYEIDGKKVELPKEIVDGIDTASVVSDDLKKVEQEIDITITKGSIKIEAARRGVLKIKNEIPLPSYKSKELKFKINPEFLLQVIEKTPKKENPVMLVDLEKKCICFENPEFKHILMMQVER